jgi:regulator of cell morphogenesis and NO signaling
MTSQDPRTDAQLVRHIVDHFHADHRRDLPRIVELAGALPPGVPAEQLAERLLRLSIDLESHQFKEEMRLFPMIEQGGSPLLGHLVDDMMAEHRAHEHAIGELRGCYDRLPDATRNGAAGRALKSALDGFFAELADHVHAEDEVLFSRFADRPRGPIRG